VRRIALIAGVIALAGWVLTAFVAPGAALQGWLIGFVAVSCPMLGALAAVLVHRLTGGTWGEAFAPELTAAARSTPLLCLYVLPVLFGAPLIYRWAAMPGALDAEVHRYFLNMPLFVLRSVVALIGWSAISLSLPRIAGPHGRLGAGLGLVFHGIAVSVVAVDWVLSVLPGWTSSNFGMDLAVQQLAAAFAWAGLLGARRVQAGSVADLTGLLFAAILGLTYLEFMSFLVVWYGDRPPLDAWYLLRAKPPWQTPVWIALALGIVATVALIVRRMIGPRRALQIASAAVLAGLLAYQVWLLAPQFGPTCLLPATMALTGMAGLGIAAMGGLPRLAQNGETAHAG